MLPAFPRSLCDVEPSCANFVSLPQVSGSDIATECWGGAFVAQGWHDHLHTDSHRPMTVYRSVAGLAVTTAVAVALALAGAMLLPEQQVAGTLLAAGAPVVVAVCIWRMVLAPLHAMRQAVAAKGDATTLAPLAGGNDDLAGLAAVHDRLAAAACVARLAADDGAAERTRLTREIHHRVKNNLQIVSSLLNIQARDPALSDPKQAYRAIQLRVNTLAIVHRWLFEDVGGSRIDVCALVQDLCTGLERGLSGGRMAAFSVRADVERIGIAQDSALPLAFLVTELASLAERAMPAHQPVELLVRMVRTDGGAMATFASAAFASGDLLLTEGHAASARITTGLVRQLRGQILYNSEACQYEAAIPLPLSAAAPTA